MTKSRSPKCDKTLPCQSLLLPGANAWHLPPKRWRGLFWLPVTVHGQLAEGHSRKAAHVLVIKKQREREELRNPSRSCPQGPVHSCRTLTVHPAVLSTWFSDLPSTPCLWAHEALGDSLDSDHSSYCASVHVQFEELWPSTCVVPFSCVNEWWNVLEMHFRHGLNWESAAFYQLASIFSGLQGLSCFLLTFVGSL